MTFGRWWHLGDDGIWAIMSYGRWSHLCDDNIWAMMIFGRWQHLDDDDIWAMMTYIYIYIYIYIWPLAMKIKVKIKFNATVKLLNIDLVYLAVRTKSLYRAVVEISLLLWTTKFKFKMTTKSSNMADRQTEHTPNAH